MVTALVLLFSFTAGAVIWLARDVDRAVSNRSAAQSIAFQAARTGAQQVVISELRSGTRADPVVDPNEARAAAFRVARELFDAYGVDGTVTSVGVSADRVDVGVRIDDPAGSVTGLASARAARGP